MSAHLTLNLPTLAQLIGASTPRAHVEIGHRSYGSHRLHFGETLDDCSLGCAIVNLGMLVPDVRVVRIDRFDSVGEFTTTQIRAALAADGITWEAS